MKHVFHLWRMIRMKYWVENTFFCKSYNIEIYKIYPSINCYPCIKFRSKRNVEIRKSNWNSMSVNCSNLRIVRDLIPSLGKGTFYPFIFSNKHQSSHRITQSSVPLFLFLPSSFPIPLCAFVRALCTYIFLLFFPFAIFDSPFQPY